jgi:hypothetical protein
MNFKMQIVKCKMKMEKGESDRLKFAICNFQFAIRYDVEITP